jgi:hypothetical protein
MFLVHGCEFFVDGRDRGVGGGQGGFLGATLLSLRVDRQ